MEASFKDFLQNLSDDEADDLWAWFDSNPNAIEEVTDVIANSHPTLT